MSGKLELEVSEHNPLFKKILESRGVQVVNKDGSTSFISKANATKKRVVMSLTIDDVSCNYVMQSEMNMSYKDSEMLIECEFYPTTEKGN